MLIIFKRTKKKEVGIRIAIYLCFVKFIIDQIWGVNGAFHESLIRYLINVCNSFQ